MRIRGFNEEDIITADRLYKKYYSSNEYPNFYSGFDFAYVVSNDNDEPILISGVKPIAEIITMTDLSKSVVDRREALYYSLHASIYSAARSGYKQLHAFTHSHSNLDRHLERVGFNKSDNKVFIMDLQEPVNGKKENI